jgi:glycosyltransferase involved in cell wall biosynthesis
VPLVSEITDVWPDAAVHSGIVKNRFLIRLAEKMELFCYRSSKRIICLTQGIEQNILVKGVAASKTCLVTNGVDIDLFDNSRFATKSVLKARLGLQREFVAMYLGAHGKYNSLDTIVDAAIELLDDNSIVFVFVGDGEQKAHLERLVSNEQLDNVLFYPPVKRSDAPEFLSMADCFLLPNISGDFFDGNLPNKVFDYLSSSRPTIVAGRVESARLVEKIKAGFVVDAEHPKQLAEAVKMVFSLSQNERDQIGVRGGEYVRMHYNRKSQSEIILSLFESVVSGVQ